MGARKRRLLDYSGCSTYEILQYMHKTIKAK